MAQLNDGRLLAFGRGDTINSKMPKSLSWDMGRTWTYGPSMFPPIGGGQRLVLLQLKEGPLFFASFADAMTIVDGAGQFHQVSGLFAAVSYDDGETWPHIRLISDDGPARQMQTTNGRTFTADWNTAEPRGYLSVCQGANGVIHLASSWNHYAFNLRWLQTPQGARPIRASKIKQSP